MAVIVLPSASRTTEQNVGVSSVRGHDHAHGVAFLIDVTDLEAGTPSITPVIEFIDPASGKKFTILSGAAIATVTSVVLRISPDLVAAANLIASDLVPELMNVRIAVADAQPCTYSIGMVHA
jgi:hypothetical protein